MLKMRLIPCLDVKDGRIDPAEALALLSSPAPEEA